MSREGRDAGPSKMETFECSLCGIEVSFDYKGRTPPYEKSIVFLEDGYFRLDPFADRRRPLFIGADCDLCSRPVCGQPTCSLFYTRRFCAHCAKKHESEFPPEMKRDLSKLSS
mmetsp:Transcript_6021/g.26620  ORF Transcript_6021/g.26620 Transcript_6021/m.26620 type:complete len:113 (-) Transcript_6021:40-378(-)